jgi:hypothetical protein
MADLYPHPDVAGYLLGALDEDEARAFAEHPLLMDALADLS